MNKAPTNTPTFQKDISNSLQHLHVSFSYSLESFQTLGHMYVYKIVSPPLRMY